MRWPATPTSSTSRFKKTYLRRPLSLNYYFEYFYLFICNGREEKTYSLHQVKWLPFLLQPRLPKEGVDKRTYYREKFGSRAIGAMEHLKTVGTVCGLCAVHAMMRSVCADWPRAQAIRSASILSMMRSSGTPSTRIVWSSMPIAKASRMRYEPYSLPRCLEPSP